MTWVKELIDAIIDTFVGITAGMVEGFTVLFQDLLVTSTGGLTVFGQYAFVILRLGLATGLFITSTILKRFYLSPILL
jgi:hypothetical protein